MTRQTAKWVRKAEDDVIGARTLAAQKPPLRNAVVFHCQQSAEKYLKAMLQELRIAIPKIHYLESLLNMLLPHDATLKSIRRILRSLTQFAVDYRYPDENATTRQMRSALKHAERVRAEVRTRLGLAV